MTDQIDALGGPTAVARMTGCKVPSVIKWRRTGIPVIRAPAIELATGGKVMRWHLRPNDWHLIWPELVGRADAPAVPGISAPDGDAAGTNAQKEAA